MKEVQYSLAKFPKLTVSASFHIIRSLEGRPQSLKISLGQNFFFVSCNSLEKNRVGRSVKKKICIIFLVKNVCFMHVLL